MKKVITITFCLTAFFEANAFTVTEALEKAYINNPQIKGYQEEYISALQDFPKTLSENFLPSINAETKISSVKSREAIDRSFSNIEDSKRTISAQQNIFAGGSSIAAITAVKHKIDIAKLTYILKEQEFILKGILTYVELIAAKEKLEASKTFVSSMQKEYEAAEEKLKVGESTTTDVAVAKAQYSYSLTDLANANTALLTKKSEFEIYFGSVHDDISLPEIPADIPANYENFSNKARALNLNSRINESALKVSKYLNASSKGSLLPKVSLFAQNSDEIRKGDLSNSRQKSKSYTTGIQINIPILDSGGAEYSKIRKSNADLRKTVYELDYSRKSIETKLISDWEQFSASKQSMIFALEAMEARKLAYEGMKSRYDVGLSPITEVLKAEKEYYDSVVQNIQVKEQHIKAAYIIKSDLAQLTAKDLGLRVKLFDPEAEFRKTKFKIIGF